MLQIFEIAELSPAWMPAPAATVSLRVLDASGEMFAIRHVNIYRRTDRRLSLGPPFVWLPDCTGRHAGLGFASAEGCKAAAEVIALPQAPHSLLPEGGGRVP